MKKIKLLILDDDLEVRKNLQMFFEDDGFDCFSFENAIQALDFIRHSPLDVAIVDLRLPIMNGEEFIIESHNITPDMKYIIYTGSTDYRVSADLSKIGITQEFVCSKPIKSMDEFIKRINSLLNNK